MKRSNTSRRLPLTTALFAGAIGLIALSAGAASAACNGPLTGPTLAIGPDMRGFGAVQGLPALSLGKGQFVLTIDDGPNLSTTPRLLEILGEHCVKATFFLVGRNAEAHPDLVRQILAAGHTIGTHTYSHPDLSKMTPPQIEADIEKGRDAVRAAAKGATGEPPSLRLFRFPGASGFPPVVPKALVDMAVADGLSVAGYDFSPQDWRNSPPTESFKRLFSGLKDSGVIVFHDGQPNTIPLLPMVLNELRKRDDKIAALAP